MRPSRECLSDKGDAGAQSTHTSERSSQGRESAHSVVLPRQRSDSGGEQSYPDGSPLDRPRRQLYHHRLSVSLSIHSLMLGQGADLADVRVMQRIRRFD